MMRSKVHFELFRRLAELNLSRMEDDACIYLMKEVLKNMQYVKMISGFSGCRTRMMRVDEGPNEVFVEAQMQADRGFLEGTFICRKSLLAPDMIPVVEVMFS